MAGTIAILENSLQDSIRSLIIKCTSDASGDASAPIPVKGGVIYGFAFLPVTGASDLWDMVVPVKKTLPDGTAITFADLLGGNGADLSNSTNGDWKYLDYPTTIPKNCVITPTISNLGDEKEVYLMFFISEDVQ